jgi:hypothetical protein
MALSAVGWPWPELGEGTPAPGEAGSWKPDCFGRILATGWPEILAGFQKLIPGPFFMLNPASYFDTDYFDTRDVTLPRLQKFSVNVIQRLTLDNPGGAFAALI